MKIAFWSNAQDSIGVTSNLACISVASVFAYSYKTVLMENHLQKNKLENLLFYDLASRKKELQHHSSQERFGYRYMINYMDYMNEEENYKSSKEVIKGASLEILNDSLYYLPLDYIQNSNTFDYSLYGSIRFILNKLDEFADITYIDTSNHNNLSSKIILEEADLIVVNFIQNKSLIIHFFENYSSILHKCVFLISNYHKNSKLDLNTISKEYLIDPSHIVAIPYNIEYQEAVLQGTVVEFITRNYKCQKKNPNYRFVYEVKKAVKMIICHLEISPKKELSSVHSKC